MIFMCVWWGVGVPARPAFRLKAQLPIFVPTPIIWISTHTTYHMVNSSTFSSISQTYSSVNVKQRFHF